MTTLDTIQEPQGEGGIRLYGPKDFEGMRKAGKLAAEALDLLVAHVQPGVRTEELDDIVEFLGAHTWLDMRNEQVERFGSKFARFAHTFEVFGTIKTNAALALGFLDGV